MRSLGGISHYYTTKLQLCRSCLRCFCCGAVVKWGKVSWLFCLLHAWRWHWWPGVCTFTCTLQFAGPSTTPKKKRKRASSNHSQRTKTESKQKGTVNGGKWGLVFRATGPGVVLGQCKPALQVGRTASVPSVNVHCRIHGTNQHQQASLNRQAQSKLHAS